MRLQLPNAILACFAAAPSTQTNPARRKYCSTVIDGNLWLTSSSDESACLSPLVPSAAIINRKTRNAMIFPQSVDSTQDGEPAEPPQQTSGTLNETEHIQLLRGW